MEMYVLMLLLVPAERDWRGTELVGLGVLLVILTLATIVSALSLVRLGLRGAGAWFSRRLQLGALISVCLLQTTLLSVIAVLPIVRTDDGGATPSVGVILLGALELCALSAAIRGVWIKEPRGRQRDTALS
ncbi:MAG: hypothetical protein ACRDY7_16170 [Acidimicrobiia bacterium]